MKKSNHESKNYQRVLVFSERLNRMLKDKHWSGADLAREASTFVPETHLKNGKRYVIGRHIISAYCRAENEPSNANLIYIASALNVEPSDLLPTKKRTSLPKPYVQVIASLGGKSRLIVDAEVTTELAMQVMQQIQNSLNRI